MSDPLVLQLRGDVDIAAVASLRPCWYRMADEGSSELVVVDLRDVTFMDAAGLGLLAGLRRRQRRHGGDVALRNASAHVMRLLGVCDLIEVFPDADLPYSGQDVSSASKDPGSTDSEA